MKTCHVDKILVFNIKIKLCCTHHYINSTFHVTGRIHLILTRNCAQREKRKTRTKSFFNKKWSLIELVFEIDVNMPKVRVQTDLLIIKNSIKASLINKPYHFLIIYWFYFGRDTWEMRGGKKRNELRGTFLFKRILVVLTNKSKVKIEMSRLIWWELITSFYVYFILDEV